MPQNDFLIANARDFIGQELALSDWITIDQHHVNAFGAATRHTHWMHCDPERAKAEGPYGGALVHGFMYASLINHAIDLCQLRPEDSAFALNYGLDKLRIIAPVVVGDGIRVRDRIVLMEVTDREDGCLTKTSHTFEVEGKSKPAAYAEYLSLWVPNR